MRTVVATWTWQAAAETRADQAARAGAGIGGRRRARRRTLPAANGPLGVDHPPRRWRPGWLRPPPAPAPPTGCTGWITPCQMRSSAGPDGHRPVAHHAEQDRRPVELEDGQADAVRRLVVGERHHLGPPPGVAEQTRSDPTARAPSTPAGPSASGQRPPMATSLRSSTTPSCSTSRRWRSEPDGSSWHPGPLLAPRHGRAVGHADPGAGRWSHPRAERHRQGRPSAAWPRHRPRVDARGATIAPVGPGWTIEAATRDAARRRPDPRRRARAVAADGPAPLATRWTPSVVARRVSGGAERTASTGCARRARPLERGAGDPPRPRRRPDSRRLPAAELGAGSSRRSGSAVVLAQRHEHRRPLAPHAGGVAAHHVEVGADHAAARSILLITSRSDAVMPGPALARHLVAAGHVDHEDLHVDEGPAERGGEVVAAALEQHQVGARTSLEVLDGVEVRADVVADGGVRAAAGLDADDALGVEHAAALEDAGVLGGEDVVGHDGQLTARRRRPRHRPATSSVLPCRPGPPMPTRRGAPAGGWRPKFTQSGNSTWKV